MNTQWMGELSRHRITEIRFREARGRYPRLHGKNAVRGYHGFGGSIRLAQLVTDQGAGGWGMLGAGLQAARDAAELLRGRPVSEVFDPEKGVTDARLIAFDFALHDLAGVILGLPVAKMINPNAAPWARVYDGAIYMNDIIPEDKPQGMETVLRDCAEDWALGHRMFKVKIGRGYRWMAHDEGMDRDVELMRRIHAQHPGAALMVDANDGFTVEDTIQFLRRIEGVPLYWFEEPFREQRDHNARLRDYLDRERPGTLIADGESDPDIAQLMELASDRLVDVLQPDVCGFGFTAWRGWLPQLAQRGFRSSPHAWGDVVKTYYCAHLAAAYPHHVPCVEAVLGSVEGVDDSGYVLSESMLTLPDRPGFGMELVWAPEMD